MADIHQEQPSIRNMQVVSEYHYQKKKLKKINLGVRFLPLKIAFFGGFENDNILSSKSYTVTKSGISPQRKPGSLRNLKLNFKR